MARLLEQALRESGFAVSVARNGREGLKLAYGHDLLVVDVMMPELNGFEMVRLLRQEGGRPPVLFLTARSGLGDVVKGLDLGGDDYLVKPYKLEELLARIRSLLRRLVDHQDVIEVADLWMDIRSRKVRRGDRWVYLSNTEFALLQLLMTRHGEVVSKPTILREVWNELGQREDNLVEVYINYLRSKLDFSGLPKLIHTVRGRGYVLEVRE